MNLHGIGTDLVDNARLGRAISRHGQAFLDRVFTSAEQNYCQSHADPLPHFAARFAAKEAVAKSLRTGIGGNAGLLDMEIVHDPSGAPKIHLSGAAEAFAKDQGITEIQISLTHAREYAAANAIAVC